MGEIKEIKLDDLIVWSDNPRIANSIIVNEDEAMKLIYEIVGENKMFALAEDIAKYGLNMNKMPIVVPIEGLNKYEVYDGNRRITILKQFARGSDKLSEIANEQNYSLESCIRVLVTDKESALRIMETDHSGQQGGKGQIQWKAFQRDIALEKLNRKCMYPIARKVSKICNHTRKKDFKKIPYTDIEGIFKSEVIKGIFNISEWDFSDEEYIRKVFEVLKKCKPVKTSYSRLLPNLKGDKLDTFKTKILTSLNTTTRVEKFSVELNKSSIFKGQLFEKKWIICRINNVLLDETKYSLTYYYEGINSNFEAIDTNKVGKWFIQVTYKDKTDKVSFQVKDYKRLILELNGVKAINVNNTMNCNEFLYKATDSYGNNCINDVLLDFYSEEAKWILNKENRSITFKEPGTVNLKAHYCDPVSGNEIEESISFVVSNQKMRTAKKNVSDKAFFVEHICTCTLDFNPLVNKIIAQLNSLYADNSYFEVSIAALRSVFEVILEQIYNKDSSLTRASNFKDKMKNLYLAFNNNDFFTYIANSDKTKMGFKDLQNLYRLNSEREIVSLVSLLHLGAHKSAKHVSESDFIAKKNLISLFIEFSFLYLNWKS